MLTGNEKIRDSILRRQMKAFQFGKGLGGRINRLLESVEKKLRMLINKHTQKLAKPRVKFNKTTLIELKVLESLITKLLKPVYTDIRELTRRELLELSKLESDFMGSTITASIPVVIDLNKPQLDTLRDAVLKRPFEGKVLRKWMQQLEAGDRRRIMDAVRIGLIRGESSIIIGRRIFGTIQNNGRDGIRDITIRGASSIAATSVNHVVNQARQLFALANKDLMPKELYVATLDVRTTDICKSLDGTIFPVGEGATPPLHFNCRSIRVPFVNGSVAGVRPANSATKRVLEGLRGQERINAVRKLVGETPASETYNEFLKKQTIAFQDQALGKTKAKLFREGGLTLDKFVNIDGRELTLAELRRKQPQAFRRAGVTL